MLLNENKLKYLIKDVIKEMALSHKGIHPVGGIKNPYYDVTSQDHLIGYNFITQKNEYGPERNIFPLNAPEKFEKKLGWILKNYPGCTIHTYMFPSNFDIDKFFIRDMMDSTYEIVDSKIKNNVISDLIFQETPQHSFDRIMDITDHIEGIISAFSEELDESDPSVQKFFNVLRDSNKLASDDQNGVLIYFGAHTNEMGHPPSPYNIMHQIVDSSKFHSNQNMFEMFNILKNISTFDGKLGIDKGFFEGRAQSISHSFEKKSPNYSYHNLQSILNLIFQSAGWLNPDTCTIMNDNPTNQGLTGSSDHHDIVRRCLAPKYKDDEEVIEQMVSLGFVDILCNLINDFWNIFRGRVILTFSIEDYDLRPMVFAKNREVKDMEQSKRKNIYVVK